MKILILLIFSVPFLGFSASEFELEAKSEKSILIYDYYKLTLSEAALIGPFMTFKYMESDIKRSDAKLDQKEHFLRIISQEKVVAGLGCTVKIIEAKNENHHFKIVDGRLSGCHPLIFKVTEVKSGEIKEYNLRHKPAAKARDAKF